MGLWPDRGASAGPRSAAGTCAGVGCGPEKPRLPGTVGVGFGIGRGVALGWKGMEGVGVGKGVEVAVGFRSTMISAGPDVDSGIAATMGSSAANGEGTSVWAGAGSGTASFVSTGDVAAQASDISMSDAATPVPGELSFIYQV